MREAPMATRRTAIPVKRKRRGQDRVRDRRFVIKVNDDERRMLDAICEDDVRSTASWFRVTIRRAWLARDPRTQAADTYQRFEGDDRERPFEVWTRLDEDERDQLEI